MLGSVHLVMPEISFTCKVPFVTNLPPTRLMWSDSFIGFSFPPCTGENWGTNKHLQNIYYVLDILLSTLQLLIYLIFMVNLQGRYFNYSDFTDKENERGQIICWWSHD